MTGSSGGVSTLVKRVLVGVVFAPILLWLFWFGGFPFFIFLVCISAFGQWELYRMSEGILRFSHRVVGYTAGLLILLGTFFNCIQCITGILIAALMSSFLIEIVSGTKRRFDTVIMSLFITVYPPVFVSFLLKVRSLPELFDSVNGRSILLYSLILIWIFDSASYFSGRAFGKLSFFPSVSPKKTVEGFIGGIVSVIITAIIVGLFAKISYIIIHGIILSVVIALVGQAGDLAESLIKRDCDVKDSSNIIPGHGGILDRFDSLLFAAPVIYGYVVLAAKYFSG